ncbi:MAG: TolC family protein [Rhodothermales bacterium]
MRLFLPLLFALSAAAMAQPASTPDTLQLGALRAAAAQQDPRAVQPDLLARATQLRLAALRAQRLPQLALSGQATVQNAVPEIPIDLPEQAVPSPPREQARVQVEADWTLYDGGRVAQQAAAERARYAEDVAGVAVTLYRLREAAAEAFFGALLFDAQAGVLALAAEDLDVRLRVVQRQAEEGAALAADAAALEAERLRIGLTIAEAEAGRRAALDVLADLTGQPLAVAALAVPDLDAEAARALAALAEEEVAAGRPERVRFDRAAARAEAEARAMEASTRPTLGLFGQAGVGRPSPFDLFADDVAEFGIVGARVRWPVFDGGRARRTAEALRVQAEIAETEAAAFDRQILRDVADERAALARLDVALAADRRIVVLREEVLRAARRQLDEGVLLPDRYTDRLTDLAEARLTLARHRIERAQAQARLLSALGRFPEPPAPAAPTLDRN